MNKIPLKITNDKLHFSKGVETKSKLSPKEKKKLAEASKGFESILTSMMLKSMTKANGGLLGKDNYGGDVLDVLFEGEIAKMISETKGLGIADKIYQNVTGEKLSKAKNISKKNSFISIPAKFNNTNSVEKKNVPSLERLGKYDHLIQKAAKKFNINEKLIKSVILTESAGKSDAISKTKAKGLMQLMDSTATEMGVDNPWDPEQNIYGGTKYLSHLLKTYEGNTELALAAYNAGPGNVNKYGGVPPFKETQNYIKRVTNYLNILDGENEY